MLDPAEAAAVIEQFGVSTQQVQRDHLLSHLLAVLARELADDVVFFGGTALARTHLPDGRLSEDLDLITKHSRRETAERVDAVLANGLRREYGRLTWNPPLSAVKDTVPGTLSTNDGLTVRIQLLDRIGYPRWPTQRRDMLQRYSDAPPANLEVPTRAAFVAAKTIAWHDRHAPRDLYDLWGLDQLGAINAAAAELYAQLGPTGRPPQPAMFATPPSTSAWITQLAAQTRIAVEPDQALADVRDSWTAAAASGRSRSRRPGPDVAG